LLACGQANLTSIAAACSSGGDASERPGDDDRTPGSRQTGSREAPGDLDEIDLPDTSETVYELFQRLPLQAAGGEQHDDFGGSAGLTLQIMYYGDFDDAGQREMTVHARDVQYLSAALPGPRDQWTSGGVVAQIASTESTAGTELSFAEFEVQRGGRDGSLQWLEFTALKLFTGPGGTPFSLPVYGVMWGATEGRWLFTVMVPSEQALDLLIESFVRAARSDGSEPVAAVAGTAPPAPTAAQYVQEPPDIADLPQSAAPFGLGRVTLPGNISGVGELFSLMPEQVADRDRRRQIESTGPRVFTAIYETESIFDRQPTLTATDIQDGSGLSDSGLEGWTAGELLTEVILAGGDASTEIVGQGRDGDMVWQRVTLTNRGVSPAEVTYHAYWADIEGKWVFEVSASTSEDIDALIAAFVAAAEAS
jgi:hypothetical protein